MKSIMQDGRTERRLLSKGRSAEKAQERSMKLRAIKEAADEREYSQQKRKILRDLGLEPDNKAWGRVFHIKVDKAAKRKNLKREKKINPSVARSGIKTYKRAIRDERGRIAIFARMRYLGQNSTGYRSGLAADHAKYIFREEGLESPEIQLATPMSNVGKTVDECAAFWNAIEPIEEGYRSNSKIQFRMIIALPYFFDAEQRRRVTQEIGDQLFGRVGLGWMAANHLPDAKGSERNFHAHFAASMRPAEYINENEWAFTEEKLTEPFTPEGLYSMRAKIAAIINIECRRAGFAERYTHQSYQRRGINAVANEHIGPKRMALYEKGETVGVIERNNARIEMNESTIKIQYASLKMALLKKIMALYTEERAQLQIQEKLQNWKTAIINVRAHASKIIETQSATKTHNDFANLYERLPQIEADVKKLKSIKQPKNLKYQTSHMLKIIIDAAQKKSRIAALAPKAIHQNFNSNISLLIKDLRHAVQIKPAQDFTALQNTTKLISQQAEAIINIRKNNHRKFVTPEIREAILIIQRNKAPMHAAIKKQHDNINKALAEINAIGSQSLANLRAGKLKQINEDFNVQSKNIIRPILNYIKLPSVNSINPSFDTALLNVEKAAYNYWRQNPPNKINSEFAPKIYHIKRLAEKILHYKKYKPLQYTNMIGELHHIRKAAEMRLIEKNIAPDASKIEQDQNELAAPKHSISDRANPANEATSKIAIPIADNQALNDELNDLFALLQKHSNSKNIQDENAIFAVIPEDKKDLVGRWKGTDALLFLRNKVRSHQERSSRDLWDKWLKAKDGAKPLRLAIANEALNQYKRWPINLPETDIKEIEADAKTYRYNLNSLQQRQNLMGR